MTPSRSSQWWSALIIAAAALAAGCNSETSGDGSATPITAATTSTEPALTTTIEPAVATPSTEPAATTTTTDLPATTTTTTEPPPTTSSTTTVPPPVSISYVVPVRDVAAAGWGDTHAGYPATDVFLPCGAEVVSPASGAALEVRTVDSWDPAVDNPATRGGRSVSILGDDGVRYYVAHLDDVDRALQPGVRVAPGQRLGTIGLTGRTSACHVHFAISPPCPGKEWSVRRGAVWPFPYLDAWRNGVHTSPAPEVADWLTANPDACAIAMADPHAANS